jgi:hypothetical protein
MSYSQVTRDDAELSVSQITDAGNMATQNKENVLIEGGEATLQTLNIDFGIISE